MGHYDRGARIVEQLGRRAVLAEDLLFVHGAALTDEELARMADTGAALAVTPETELQMGMGFPATARARAKGVRMGLGVDIVSNYAGDMFVPMRLDLQVRRAMEHERQDGVPLVVATGVREALTLATTAGAEAVGLGRQVGTLAPGKQADLIIVAAESWHMSPAPDAVAALVLGANASDVRDVFVAGRPRKRDGHLVGVDPCALQAALGRSAAGVLRRAAAVDDAPIRRMLAAIMG
jgi:5-methylthioadenosine/S-adenosylhomocysteine deaminase